MQQELPPWRARARKWREEGRFHSSKRLLALLSFFLIFNLIFILHWNIVDLWASQVVLMVKNPPANARDIKDVGLIPGSGRSPGGEHGNPLQYSCLENPMDRGDWWATIHRVAKNHT